MKKLILIFLFNALLLLTAFVMGSHAGTFSIDTFLGMHTTESELLIPIEKSKDMDNVDISEDGMSLLRKKGQKALFTITYATHHVTSLGNVKNNVYDKLLVGYGPHIEAIDTAYSSTMLHSSATAGYVWDYAKSIDGNTYCTNGVDTVFYTDGNTKTFIPTAPKGTSIVFFNNTCMISNITGDRARLFIGVYGDASDWTTGDGITDGDSIDVADYGEKIVALEVLGNSVLILCSQSIMKLIGNQNPYLIVEVDKSIGCKSKGSISVHLGWVYFLGSDGQKYKTNGSIIEDISSDNFYDDFNNTALAQKSANFSTITTETEFALGITSHTSTSDSSGDVVLSSYTQTFDNFSDGDYTNNPTWTAEDDNAWQITSNTLERHTVTSPILVNIYASLPSIVSDSNNVTVSFGINFPSGFSATYPFIEFFIYGEDGTPNVDYAKIVVYHPSSSNEDYLRVTISGAGSSTTGEFVNLIAEDTWYTIKVVKVGTNFKVYSNDVLYIDKTSEGAIIPSNAKIIIDGAVYSAGGGTVQIDTITIEGRYRDTGYYISPVFTIANINAWGLIEISETLNDGTIDYTAFSTNTLVSSADLQDATKVTWVDQTKDAIITVSTNTYLYVKSTFTVTLNQTPVLESLTINWVSGSDTTEDMTAYWHNERLYLGVMKSTVSSTNDACFVYDPKLDAWWKYKTNTFPSVLYKWKNMFLIASSTYGVVAQFLEGDKDLGNNIDAYYKTKYISVGGLNTISSFESISFVYDQQSSGNLLVDYYLNGATTAEGIFTLDQTGGDKIHIESFNFPLATNSYFIQFKIYNSGGSDFSFHGLYGTEKPFPFRVGQ